MEESEKRLKEKRKEVEEGWTTAIAGLCCQSKLFREDLKPQSTKQLQKALMHTHTRLQTCIYVGPLPF